MRALLIGLAFVGALAIGIVAGVLISRSPALDAKRGFGDKESRVRAAIAATFFDPDSVRLEDLRIVPATKAMPIRKAANGGPAPDTWGGVDFVCGKVNAKNRMGGYVGSKEFAGMYADSGRDFLESNDPLEIERFKRDFGIDPTAVEGALFLPMLMGERHSIEGETAHKMCADAAFKAG